MYSDTYRPHRPVRALSLLVALFSFGMASGRRAKGLPSAALRGASGEEERLAPGASAAAAIAVAMPVVAVQRTATPDSSSVGAAGRSSFD